MSELRFEWDPRKAVSNERKHGVSFDEATTVFSDDHAILLDDPDHSDDVIRLISARKATRKERAEYGRRWRA
jgi:hypothetical protein